MTTTLCTQPLSSALREHTAHAHEQAEGSTFMADLLEGNLDAAAYAALSAQLWFVYSALEQATRTVRNTDLAQPFAQPALERRKRIEHDLTTLLGQDWQDNIQLLPATARYMTRLAEIATPEHAHLVIAHHYVRYLGDLSGGQVIARMMHNHYNISEDALTFYDFSAVGRLPHFRTEYRTNLDNLALTSTQREELLNEAAVAFACNSAVFADLERAERRK